MGLPSLGLKIVSTLLMSRYLRVVFSLSFTLLSLIFSHFSRSPPSSVLFLILFLSLSHTHNLIDTKKKLHRFLYFRTHRVKLKYPE